MVFLCGAEFRLSKDASLKQTCSNAGKSGNRLLIIQQISSLDGMNGTLKSTSLINVADLDCSGAYIVERDLWNVRISYLVISVNDVLRTTYFVAELWLVKMLMMKMKCYDESILRFCIDSKMSMSI
jgi:hypothetical protein